MGHKDIVVVLLANDADKHIQAEGYTALALAKVRENHAIVELLN